MQGTYSVLNSCLTVVPVRQQAVNDRARTNIMLFKNFILLNYPPPHTANDCLISIVSVFGNPKLDL